MDDIKRKTTIEDPPVFDTWNKWYALIVVSNLIIVSLIYFYFKSI